MNLPDGLFAPPISHRGLWRPGEFPENSLSAFEAACQSGYGVELDVWMSRDGQPVVFHDEQLERLTGVEASVWDLTALELGELPLLGAPDRIPTLQQALELIAGRVMLLVEIKSGQDGDGALEAQVARLLGRYRGPAAVISFDPAALAWFALNHPEWPRGLDAMGLSDVELAAAPEGTEEAFAAQRTIADPQFLVLEKESARGRVARRVRQQEGLPVIAWTIRSPEEADLVAEDSHNFIFEGFVP